MWSESEQKFSKGGVLISLQSKIVNVSPMDFDGDGCLDVLIVAESQHNSEKNVTVYVHWGNSKTLDANGLELVMKDQPLVMDANGDLLPDLFGTEIAINSSLRSYWISQGRESLFSHLMTQKK